MSRLIRWVVEEPLDWADAFAALLPGRVGRLLRRVWTAGRVKALGRRVVLGAGIRLSGGENIRIGDDFAMLDSGRLDAIGGSIMIGNRVSFNYNVCIDAADDGDIQIGDDVLIGPNTVLRASNHTFSRTDVPIRDQGHTGGTIVIENGVWIGANCSILPGVRVGSGAIVGAGAVVTRDVPPGSIVGGSPAREIGQRR